MEHLSTFQRLVLEFKGKISETVNFTLPWQSKCVGSFCLEVRFSDVPLRSLRYPAPHLYRAPARSAQSASREWTLGWCFLLGSQTGMCPQEFATRTCNTMNHHHLLFCLSLKEQRIEKGFFCESMPKCYYVHKENSVYV